MNGKRLNRLELIVERGAAAIFGAAAGFAVFVGQLGFAGQPERAICAAAAAIIANLLCTRALQAWAAAGPQFIVPAFDQVPVEMQDELLLTEADIVHPELVLTNADRLPAEEPLELDDVLAELRPDSRVVRLFDPAKMPTPGQLNSRIEAYKARSEATYPDASQQLSEALAELRRSLR
jgi:hypothetical protein